MDYIRAIAITILVLVAITDVREARIPNVLLVGLTGEWALSETISQICKTPVFTGEEVVERLLLALFVAAILYPFFIIGGLGAGDIKLLAATILVCKKPVEFLFLSFLIGAVFGVFKTVYERVIKGNSGLRIGIHMGVPVLLAYCMAVYL